jgi:N-acetylglutamate synthase-like GNAT family acetyltransferase
MRNIAETGRDDSTDPTEPAEPQETIIPYTDEFKDRLERFFESLKAEGQISESASVDKIKGNLLLAVDSNNDVVGTAVLNDCENNIGYLCGMYVKKESRGKKIGEQLLTNSVESAKLKGFRRIFLATLPENKRAQKFYAKNGFQQIESPPQTSMTFHDGTVFFEMDLPEIKK